ncbi:MAG TPA: pseudouridine synthase [Pararhodobacter sp.]|uniref:pseudouridine synthase n=1 Tax=Pararhodobacter sp. TaxID=2127056 RepID=UPI001DB4AAAF|nr:pseudouridine synthase [Pararhodobacter sp.]MCB1343833.1 rRNA pseudouridine synthase [Paracoccaceae bacterium]HPD91742.1 pseudouridine synthase [Pararhodobacter sp.]
MTKPPAAKTPPKPQTQGGERIAKVLARAGVASRRSAEAMILEGRVSVNGAPIDSPALNVTPRDRIVVDGKPLGAKEPTRVWLYHKPLGLVTSEKDEKGRETVFDTLPEGMPRVLSIGRLDLNSEGLLLLTNDGDLKRRLELPSTGWLRKYRVRVNGAPTEAMLAPLKQGVTIDGERFHPMLVAIDRQQGANAWLTIGLREGRNREIRRALDSVGLTVNRLIRTAYGPFQLGDLAPGAVEELRPRVLRDQLGLSADEVADGRAPAPPAKKTAPRATSKPGPKTDPTGAEKPARKSWGMKSHGGARTETDGSRGKPRSWGTKSARPPTKPGPTR